MNTRRFLELVWPPKGPYCIATPWIKPDGKKTYAHYGCDTIDDAIAYIALKKPSKDLYFGTHGLKIVREPNPNMPGRFKTFRTKENMRECREFFFDMDVGYIKSLKKIVYATQQDALNKLEEFLFRAGLPSPFVISSGYGVHVHWPIDTPIESTTWVTPAAKLHALAERHKMYVDPSKVFEQTTVLRIPNTFNYKDPANPRKVQILAEGVVTNTDKFLDQLDILVSDEFSPATGAAKPSRVSGHLDVAWDGRHPPADEVADVCEHMRSFRDTGGNISEPLWHVGVGTIKHCDDGEAKVHEWSSGYPDYTSDETQAKIDAWKTPPPSCDKIDEKSGDPAVCQRCPRKDLAKNPLLIANMVYQHAYLQSQARAQAQSPGGIPTPSCPPPSPFKLDMTHGVATKKDGIICEYPMFPVHWVSATPNESCLSRWYVKPPRADWKMVEILNSELELKTLGGALRNKDVIVLSKHIKHMHTFMNAYVRDLHKYQDSLKQYDYLGFEAPVQEPTEIATPLDFGDPEWFILYGRKIRIADGSIVPCVMTQNTKLNCMGRIGTMSQQITALEFYNNPAYMAQQFIIALSLATPFFRFSGLPGMVVCLTGDTGASKSTGLYAASSLWGHPEYLPISGLRSNATDKGRQERGAIPANLPFFCDEVTRFDAQTAHEIALAASQPGNFISLTSKRDFRAGRGGIKSNVTIATSNRSLTQLVNTDSAGGQAGIMRIFEIKVDRSNVHTKTEADNFKRQLNRNYGWIGEDFLSKCLPSFKAIEKIYLKILEEFEQDINASQEERFMTAGCADALLGVKLGNKLGYWRFDYKAMREWLINVQVPAMRNAAKLEREHMSSEAVLNDYLEEINPNMCRINQNNRKETEILYAPNMEFKARYEVFKGEIYVRIGPFRAYCNERGHDYNNILEQLAKNGTITNTSVKKRMRNEPGNFSSPILCFVISTKTAAIVVPNAPDNIKIVEFKTKRPTPDPSASPPGRSAPK